MNHIHLTSVGARHRVLHISIREEGETRDHGTADVSIPVGCGPESSVNRSVCHMQLLQRAIRLSMPFCCSSRLWEEGCLKALQLRGVLIGKRVQFCVYGVLVGRLRGVVDALQSLAKTEMARCQHSPIPRPDDILWHRFAAVRRNLG